ncbi:MAG: FtsH protease activity modulator HflK [Hyphomicrobiales bacterium]|nr:FtsH protease activity modulator HflK [Hyphomicrobiales bacterium]
MPWSDQGGPTGPGGQSPWGQGGGGNPWNARPNGPDLEEALRKGQERLRAMLPGGATGGRPVLLAVLAGFLLWLASGFYIVSTNQVGLNLVFGKFTGKTKEGLNYNWPWPIGSVEKLNVTDFNAIDVGSEMRNARTQVDVPEESLMLTGDENIADVKFRVIWKIDDQKPEAYAFNVYNPPATVKAVAESAMREIVGRSQIQKLLTAERKVIEPAAQDLMQRVLDSYNAGVNIVQVQLLSVDPPASVISAFRDVTAAQQDRDRLKNEAEGYANKVVPEARGQAARIQQEAQAYREQTVAEAKGQASRFDQVYEEYKKAPDVTRQRLYLETMERVLGRVDKVIVDKGAGTGVVPYLPLGDLKAAPAQGAGGQK